MSDNDNKWEQPAAPPPPLFTGQKEKDLVKQVTDEVIERVIGTSILYYPISIKYSDFHPLYGEAINKTYLPPVHVEVLAEWEGEETATTGFGIDKKSSVTIHFHKRRLTEDQNLFVREGDFIQYGEQKYEIVQLAQPKLLFGQPDSKIEISAKCVRARDGTFPSESYADDGDDDPRLTAPACDPIQEIRVLTGDTTSTGGSGEQPCGEVYERPGTPPPPLFTGRKESNLVKQVNDEVLERVVGQQVVYFPISIPNSDFHELYGEALNKTFLPPIRVFAAVEWKGSETTTTNFGIDRKSAIEVKFHKRRLTEDQNLFVREGDFVLYGNILYEIITVGQPKLLFGKIDEKFEVVASCIRAREGIFRLSEAEGTVNEFDLDSVTACENANIITPDGVDNTMSNVGSGEGVFRNKTGINFNMKTLVEGDNITLTSTADEITINSSGGGGDWDGQLDGNAGITGSLDVSGSTSFGNLMTDTHTFTGSILQTGSGATSTFIDEVHLMGDVGIGTTSPPSYGGYTSLALNNELSGGIIDFQSDGSRIGAIYNDDTSFFVAGDGPLKLGCSTGDVTLTPASGESVVVDGNFELTGGNADFKYGDHVFSGSITFKSTALHMATELTGVQYPPPYCGRFTIDNRYRGIPADPSGTLLLYSQQSSNQDRHLFGANLENFYPFNNPGSTASSSLSQDEKDALVFGVRGDRGVNNPAGGRTVIESRYVELGNQDFFSSNVFKKSDYNESVFINPGLMVAVGNSPGIYMVASSSEAQEIPYGTKAGEAKIGQYDNSGQNSNLNIQNEAVGHSLIFRTRDSYGSFATTMPPRLTIEGSGTVIISGSTRMGQLSTDTHKFSGSLQVGSASAQHASNLSHGGIPAFEVRNNGQLRTKNDGAKGFEFVSENTLNAGDGMVATFYMGDTNPESPTEVMRLDRVGGFYGVQGLHLNALGEIPFGNQDVRVQVTATETEDYGGLSPYNDAIGLTGSMLGRSDKRWKEVHGVTASFTELSASSTISASAFFGDGSGITGVTGDWDGQHTGDAAITGSLDVSTSTSFGSDAADSHVFSGSLDISGNLIPNARFSHNLGSLSKPWRTLYVGHSSLHFVSGTTDVGTLSISDDSVLTYTGSTTFGNSLTDTHQFTGSFLQTGSGGTSVFKDEVNFMGNVDVVGDMSASAFVGSGTGLVGVTGSWDGKFTGDGEITGTLDVSRSTNFGSAILDSHNFEGTINSSGNILPYSRFSHDLGALLKPWNALYVRRSSLHFVSGTTAVGTLSVTGPGNVLTYTGSMSASSFVGNDMTVSTLTASGIEVHGHIAPASGNLYDIGTIDKQVRDIYVSTGSIIFGGTHKIQVDPNDGGFVFNTPPGMPSLAGLTASYVDVENVIGLPDVLTETENRLQTQIDSLSDQVENMPAGGSSTVIAVAGIGSGIMLISDDGEGGINRAILQEYATNSVSYTGKTLYLAATSSNPVVPFAIPSKFYFNEGGVWHPSHFFSDCPSEEPQVSLHPDMSDILSLDATLPADYAVLVGLHENSSSYGGRAIYLRKTGSAPVGDFEQEEKYYFNEGGNWHASVFYSKEEEQ